MSVKNKFLSAVVAVIFLSGFVRKDSDIYFEINKSIDIFGRVYKEVTLNYVDELNPQEFMMAGIDGMLESLDPYTTFIDGNEQKDIDIITKGKYGGIGATVGIRNESITVVDLIEGYSAQRQGMRIGDVIIKIDDVDVTKENYNRLSDMLKGEPGTAVKILVSREGSNENILFNLVREEIEVKNISYYGFYPLESRNAYIKLSGFSRSAGEEVKKALLDLKSKREIESIILDLRGNPGGLLDAAIDVAEKFLQKGQLVVSVMSRDSSNSKKHFSLEEPVAGNTRLVVLIDGGSASASEIVAGALQDHDRAVIVGTNSFGKGLVQTLIPLSYNTSLKITTARYYTPSGRSIQKIDYSEMNKVFKNSAAIKEKEFSTDNSRKVFSAGGIKPDSIVDNKSKSTLVQRLVAEGMFFRFATNLYNSDVKMNYNGFNRDLLLKEFKNYLKSQKFNFVSTSEKLIEQLKAAALQENLDPKFIDQLEKAKQQLAENHSNELDRYKDEIAAQILEELVARTHGRVGRITESLKNDAQVRTALSILNTMAVYNRFLNFMR